MEQNKLNPVRSTGPTVARTGVLPVSLKEPTFHDSEWGHMTYTGLVQISNWPRRQTDIFQISFFGSISKSISEFEL